MNLGCAGERRTTLHTLLYSMPTGAVLCKERDRDKAFIRSIDRSIVRTIQSTCSNNLACLPDKSRLHAHADAMPCVLQNGKAPGTLPSPVGGTSELHACKSQTLVRASGPQSLSQHSTATTLLHHSCWGTDGEQVIHGRTCTRTP
jgi:hypothetical protein